MDWPSNESKETSIDGVCFFIITLSNDIIIIICTKRIVSRSYRFVRPL